MRWLDSITDAMDMNLGKLWVMVRDREAWTAAVHGVAKREDLAMEQTTIANPVHQSFLYKTLNWFSSFHMGQIIALITTSF